MDKMDLCGPYLKKDLDLLIDRCYLNKKKKIGLQFSRERLSISCKVAQYLKNKTVGNDISFHILSDVARSSCCVDYITAKHLYIDLIAHFDETCFSESVKTSEICVFNIFESRQIDSEQICTQISSELENSKTTENIEKAVILLDFCYLHIFPKFKFDSRNANIEIELMRRNDLKTSFSLGEYKEKTALFWIGEKCKFLESIIVSNNCRKVYILGKNKMSLLKIDTNRILMERYLYVEEIRAAKTIGIIISFSTRIDVVDKLKAMIRKAGKRAYLISFGRITEPKLENFPEVDIFVAVSCSLNNLMSPRDFHKLVANPFDAELALSKTKEWDGRYPMQTKNLLLDSENGVDELERATRSMVLQEKHRVEIIKNIEKSAFYGVSEEGSEEPAKIEKGLHGIARDYGKIK